MIVFYCIVNLAVVAILFAAWVARDGLHRPDLPTGDLLLWVLGTFFLTPIIFPIYLARRPLRGAEVRTGGPDWIVARHFIWVWTIFMAVVFAWTLILTITGETDIARGESVSQDDFDRAQLVSRSVALFFLFLCWLLPALAAFFMGPQLRDPDAIPEYGPDAPHPDVQIVDPET